MSTRRRRRSKRRWLIVALAALTALIVWAVWPRGENTDAPEDANTPGAGSVAGANAGANGGGPNLSDLGASPVVPPPLTEHTGQSSAGRGPSPASPSNAGRSNAGASNAGASNASRSTADRNQPPKRPASGTTHSAGNAPPSQPGVLTLGPSKSSPRAASANDAIPGLEALLRGLTLSATGNSAGSLRSGMKLIEDGKYVEGRKQLSALLTSGRLSPRDAQTVRDTLASVNRSLVFSDRVVAGDPLVEHYVVQSGDLLLRIANKHQVTYQFLEQINNVDARRIRVGQKLKIVNGPFHAVVSKSAYRMDLYLPDADKMLIYIYSFPVGLGSGNSTPVGSWVVRKGSKMVNPSWTHPRTNKYFAPDNPKNPIGEHWLGLEGTDANTKGLRGYGIHGTIEPESIGKQASLGCVRMLPKDVEVVFKLLIESKSTVVIQP